MKNFFKYIIKKETKEYLKQGYEKNEKILDVINNKMIELFYQYLIAGGMSQVIEKFRSTHNMVDVIEEHLSIIEIYKVDFSKCEEDNKKLILIENILKFLT